MIKLSHLPGALKVWSTNNGKAQVLSGRPDWPETWIALSRSGNRFRLFSSSTALEHYWGSHDVRGPEPTSPKEAYRTLVQTVLDSGKLYSELAGYDQVFMPLLENTVLPDIRKFQEDYEREVKGSE